MLRTVITTIALLTAGPAFASAVPSTPTEAEARAEKAAKMEALIPYALVQAAGGKVNQVGAALTAKPTHPKRNEALAVYESMKLALARAELAREKLNKADFQKQSNSITASNAKACGLVGGC